MIKNLPAMQETCLGSIPGLERSPGEGNVYPLQYSCQENSMDRGAWSRDMGQTSEDHGSRTLRTPVTAGKLCWEHFVVTMKQWLINNTHIVDSASVAAQMVKNQPAMWETWFQYLGWADPRKKGMATHFQYSGEFHEQRSLVGYSPWGFKVSDTIERLSLHFIADFGECSLC